MPTEKIASVLVGQKLRNLRRKYGARTTAELSQRMNGAYSPVVIARRETGKIRIDLSYLEAFFNALNVNRDDRRNVLHSARIGMLHARSDIRGIFNEYWNLLNTFNTLSLYSACWIPPGLQTMGYSKAVLVAMGKEGSADEKSRRKMKWASDCKADTQRRVRLVFSENAMYTPVGSPQIMIEQLNAINAFEETPRFEFRILPNSRFLRAVTAEMFGIFNGTLCFSETQLNLVTSEDPTALMHLSSTFEAIWEQSVIGVQRSRTVQMAIDHYRAIFARK